MTQADAWRMIRRRARATGIETAIGCHTFRATGITAYLESGGTLEHAQRIAAYESPRTTKLYDRTTDKVSLDEIERTRSSGVRSDPRPASGKPTAPDAQPCSFRDERR